MPLTTRNWTGAGGHPQAGPALPGLPASFATEVSNAIGQLQPQAVFGQPGPTNVQAVHGWRIDRQNAPAGFVNVSVQKNNVGAPSTVASVFVPDSLNAAPPPFGSPQRLSYDARLKELMRAVRRGLEESLATHVVTQTAPSPTGPKPTTATITRKEVTGGYSS